LQVIYKGCASDGVAFFNAGAEKKATQDYATALDYFKKAVSVRNFALSQGFKPVFEPNDTVLLYNTTQAAINAQREDDALLYGRKLAEKGIAAAGSYTKADFENIYQWLVAYYATKKDNNSLQAYAAIGAKIYPLNLYFASTSINSYRETGNYIQMIQGYEAAIKRFAGNNALQYSFCNELFTYIYATSGTTTSKKTFYTKLEQNLQQYLKKQPDSAGAYLLLGKHFYNKAADLQKAGTGSKTILLALTQAVKYLKICTSKQADPLSIIRKEAFETLIIVLKAAGRKGEATAAYNQMMGF
jgi:hypothetical protein